MKFNFFCLLTLIFAASNTAPEYARAQTPTPTPAQPEVFLGRITNSSLGQSIEIYCTLGTAAVCTKFAFYYSSGVRDTHAFAKIKNGTLTHVINLQDNKFKFFAAARQVFDNGDGHVSDAIMPIFVFGIGEVLVLTDVIIFPFRKIAYTAKRKRFLAARKSIYDALTTGGTVNVGNKTYNRIVELITSATEWNNVPGYGYDQ